MAATATSVFVTMATAASKAMIVQINHPPLPLYHICLAKRLDNLKVKITAELLLRKASLDKTIFFKELCFNSHHRNVEPTKRSFLCLLPGAFMTVFGGRSSP